MSDYEALLHFNRRQVSSEMIQYLASNTACIIQIKPSRSLIDVALPAPSLPQFIKNLVSHSNVQTSTLMATTVYLSKLRSIIPGNVYGIETTRHRIFLGCLILAAKTLNDSSPLNKHWASYTGGLLHIREVNTIERELLEYFDWNVTITTEELITCLSPFIQPIKEQFLQHKQQNLLLFNAPLQGQLKEYVNGPKTYVSDAHSRSSSNYSLPSLASTATLSTIDSRRSKLSQYKIHSINESDESPEVSGRNPYRSPLSDKENINQHFAPKKTNSDSRSTKKTRPLILTRKESKYPTGTHTTSIKKSNWQSLFT